MSLICPASSKVATMDTRFLKLCCSDIAHGRCDEIHEVFLKLRYVKFTPALSKDHCDQLYICQRGRSGFGDGIRELELELPQHLDTNIFPFQNKNNIHLSNKYNCQKLRILNHSVHFLSMTVFEYFSYDKVLPTSCTYMWWYVGFYVCVCKVLSRGKEWYVLYVFRVS